MIPENLRYSKEHEWVSLEPGSIAVIGISQFAQEQLGDIVYVDLPKPGASFRQFAKFGEVESVKAVNDLFLPLGGEIAAVNPKLTQTPELVNQEPYGEGWMVRVKLDNPADMEALMSASQYKDFIAQPH